MGKNIYTYNAIKQVDVAFSRLLNRSSLQNVIPSQKKKKKKKSVFLLLFWAASQKGLAVVTSFSATCQYGSFTRYSFHSDIQLANFLVFPAHNIRVPHHHQQHSVNLDGV